MASVSVIIPTYKHRDFISETLESVYAQTFKDYEIIVVNDGSPDDTAAVLAPHIQSGRIRYIEQENAGPAAARNRGLACATGSLIAFLDDDDVWPTTKLEQQVGIMTQSDCAIVGGIAGMIENGHRSHPLETDHIEKIDLLSAFGSSPFYSPGQALFRRSALEKVGGFDPRIWGVDDYDIYVRIAMIGSIVRVSRCGLYYRVHSGNASRAVTSMYWNLLESVNKNASQAPPQLQRIARRAGYLWGFRYAGRRLFLNSILGPQRNWTTARRVFFSLLGASVRDPGLGIRIALDITPLRLRNSIRRLMGKNSRLNASS